MLTLVSKDSVKIGDHFDVLCVLIACMVLEIINQMSKNQKSSLIVWNTVDMCSKLFATFILYPVLSVQVCPRTIKVSPPPFYLGRFSHDKKYQATVPQCVSKL